VARRGNADLAALLSDDPVDEVDLGAADGRASSLRVFELSAARIAVSISSSALASPSAARARVSGSCARMCSS